MEFGIIDETDMSFTYPRPVDTTRPTLQEAIAVALEFIEEGREEVTITLARYSHRQGCMVENSKDGYITIVASNRKVIK